MDEKHPLVVAIRFIKSNGQDVHGFRRALASRYKVSVEDVDRVVDMVYGKDFVALHPEDSARIIADKMARAGWRDPLEEGGE